MMRLEPNAVLKYFEPLDAFIKIRIFTSTEAANLFRNSRIPDRRAFVDLVVNACVVSCTEILSRLDSKLLADRQGVVEKLFALCVEVNPHLDITKVAIPVADVPTAEIHLLDQAPAQRNVATLKDLESRLAERVIGQPQAIAAVARALRKAITGLRNPERPVATFFFVGQTGVGKTELAKAITLTTTGDLGRMLRVDCSEYALPHEYAKLLGAPPGYIGFEQGGLLSERLGRGESVVLFDEIEKSDPKVHDLLLQAMDEGFVTDSKGRRIPFGDTIVILTSNVGAEDIEALRNRIGFNLAPQRLPPEQLFEEIFGSLKKRFKPEFVNRLTEVVLFNPIGLPECVQIVRRLLAEVQRHAANVPLRVQFTDPVAPLLAERGYKPEYGARELRRTVERDVEGPLSELLVEGRIREGDTVVVRVSRDQLEFHRN